MGRDRKEMKRPIEALLCGAEERVRRSVHGIDVGSIQGTADGFDDVAWG